VALLLSVDPTLSPDAVKSILTQTASQMPGVSEFEVGAGYINVYAAVDKAFHRNKPYGGYGGPLDLQHYNLSIATSNVAQQPFHIDYNPASTPGPGSANSTTFTVQAGISVLDVFANHIDDALATGNGNTIGLLLTDPNGKVYSSGIALPILDAPNREVVVNNPVPGSWLLEIRGVRGLAALPEVSLPTSGAALPGPVDGTITQKVTTLPAIADIQGNPSRPEIEFVLKNRIMDVMSDGQFHPSLEVTRGDFSQALVMNTALRQSLADSPLYTDTSGSLEAIAEAVTADGSTLRDYDFTPTGMIATHGSGFSDSSGVNTTDVAVALVKALGLDAAAVAKAGSDVTANYNGQPVVVSDEADIPPALRGYVQLALDRGIVTALFSFEQGPNDPQPRLVAEVKPINLMTRALLASALDHYRQAFAAGN
jgi:serine protease AprX